MLIAPLIREPGRVVSTGRALVPMQPNFYDLFFCLPCCPVEVSCAKERPGLMVDKGDTIFFIYYFLA
jgi:hypothetical protein